MSTQRPDPNLVLDQADDLNGQTMYRLTMVHPFPNFVKAASSDDVVGPENLESHCYAYPFGRRYPCHTAAATYVSTRFFIEKRAEWDAPTAQLIEQNLAKFANFHGISERIALMQKELTENVGQVKEAAAEDYALVVDGEKHFPVRNPAETMKCAEYILQYRDELPYEFRQQMAEKVLEKAAAFNVAFGDLEDELERQAGLGVCPADEIVQFLHERSVLQKQAGQHLFAVKMAELADACKKNETGIYDNEQIVKLAALVDNVDRETNLKSVFADMRAPEDVFFQLNVKTASKLLAEHVSTTSGNIYKKADLEQASLQTLAEGMGEEFAQAVSAGGVYVDSTKLAEIVPTLPRGDAELLDRLLDSMGIAPVAKEAAHEKGGFEDDDFKALAALHVAQK